MMRDPLRPHEGLDRSALEGSAPDDVDRLFARLTQLPPPRDFSANVLLAVRAYRPSRRQVAWAAAEVAAVLALGLLAFVVGQTLVGGGALQVLGALASDATLVRALPGDTLLAVLDTMPWIELGGLLLAAAAVVVCGRELSRSLADPAGRAPRPGGG